MAAYRRVYDSRHLQADCQEPGPISSGTLRSVIEYGLAFLKVLTNDERRFAFRTEKKYTLAYSQCSSYDRVCTSTGSNELKQAL